MVDLPSGFNTDAFAFGNGRFVLAATLTDMVVYSEDGATWYKTTSGASHLWSKMLFANGRFLLAAQGGRDSDGTVKLKPYATLSDDGVTWSAAIRRLENVDGEDTTATVRQVLEVPDAPLIVTATHGENNTGTVDYSSSEILAAVSAGREVYLRLGAGTVALVFAFGGTFQGQPVFYNFCDMGLTTKGTLVVVDGNQVDVYDSGFATIDDLDVYKNTIEPQLLPEVTAADNGKFARVVNGTWAAQALTNVAEEGA